MQCSTPYALWRRSIGLYTRIGCSCQHRDDRQRQKRLRIFPGGEDFADKFAPPLVLFMAEDQLQQLREHTRQVEIANAPSWKHFEYVLESDSGINAMLETALRYLLLALIRCTAYNLCRNASAILAFLWPGMIFAMLLSERYSHACVCTMPKISNCSCNATLLFQCAAQPVWGLRDLVTAGPSSAPGMTVPKSTSMTLAKAAWCAAVLPVPQTVTLPWQMQPLATLLP